MKFGKVVHYLRCEDSVEKYCFVLGLVPDFSEWVAVFVPSRVMLLHVDEVRLVNPRRFPISEVDKRRLMLLWLRSSEFYSRALSGRIA